MIVTTYTCDKCKHSQTEKDKPRQLWSVGITLATVLRAPYSSTNPVHTAQWCRECLISFGIMVPSKTDETKAPISPPTFDEMLRDLIQEEMESSQA